MRLYPRNGPQAVIDHPDWGHFEAGEHGGFDLPDELSDELHSFHHRGKPVWETEDERAAREQGEDLGRRRDPAALYDAVTDAFKRVAGNLTPSGATAAPDRDTEIAALRQRLAELEAAAGDTVTEDPAATGDDVDGGADESGEQSKPPARRRTQVGKTTT